MRKAEFVKACAEGCGVPQKYMKEYLKVIGEVIVDGMKDEEGVVPFAGIRFFTKYVEPRLGRNPMTGEAVDIPGKYSPRVKFAASVKEAIQ